MNPNSKAMKALRILYKNKRSMTGVELTKALGLKWDELHSNLRYMISRGMIRKEIIREGSKKTAIFSIKNMKQVKYKLKKHNLDT